MKKFLSILAIPALMTSFWACDDDSSSTPDAPTITAPAVTNVQVDAAADVTFAVTVPGGYQSVAVSGTGGTTEKKSEPSVGATSGNVVVTYTADATSGAGSVTITVTDANNKTATQTGVVNKAVEPTEIIVSSNVTADATWETGKTYILAGRIAVVDGVTLTIEPGTLVKGQAGTGANATALLIARGGKLMAEGTAELPIIFTSVSDEITPEDIAAGDFSSPNLDPVTNGLWGGLLVLGKATISASAAEVQIEGIPTSDANGLYGGTVDDDNSGVLKYISIRHGGADIGAGNEINGLSLGGVGSGTTIDHIEVVSNQDDGIEWFGGTVNVTNVVVWNVGDDGIDTDQSWSGTLDNFFVVSPDGSCFELDGPEGAFKAGHTLKNGTIVASGDLTSGALIDLDPASIVNLENLFFTGLVDGQVIGFIEPEQGAFAGTCNDDGCPFTSVEIELPDSFVLADFIQDGAALSGVSAVATPTVGATGSVFGWTWAAQAGALDGF